MPVLGVAGTDFPQFLLIRDPGTKIRVLRENIVRNTNFPGGESSGLWREGRGVGQVPSLLLLGGLERRDGAPDLAPLQTGAAQRRGLLQL